MGATDNKHGAAWLWCTAAEEDSIWRMAMMGAHTVIRHVVWHTTPHTSNCTTWWDWCQVSNCYSCVRSCLTLPGLIHATAMSILISNSDVRMQFAGKWIWVFVILLFNRRESDTTCTTSWANKIEILDLWHLHVTYIIIHLSCRSDVR